MQDLSILRARDLSRTAKEVFEAILGRNIPDDEEVGIWASRPHEARTGQARKEAWRDLNQHLDHLGSTEGRPPNSDPHRAVTIHRYHPSKEFGGILGALNLEMSNIELLIKKGFDDASHHDCRDTQCVFPI